MGTTRLPALGLEDTAARIEAACAAREPKMDPWEASLPKVFCSGAWANDRCASALSAIASALVHADTGAPKMALIAVRAAAAEVRAWRLSLPEVKQASIVLTARYSVRGALCWAICEMVGADRSGGQHRVWCIESAETYLRIAGEALIAQGAE